MIEIKPKKGGKFSRGWYNSPKSIISAIITILSRSYYRVIAVLLCCNSSIMLLF